MTDARERIGNHLALDLELAPIRDVTEQIAATQWIGKRLSPIGRRLLDRERLGKGDSLPHALDARAHALARNRAGHEDDLAVHARNHPAASRRLVDGERDGLSWREHASRQP